MSLVVLEVVEQRHAAVLEVVKDGRPVVEVAARYGVSRQTVIAQLFAPATAAAPRRWTAADPGFDCGGGAVLDHIEQPAAVEVDEPGHP